MTDEQTEIAKQDTQKEIVIRSQEELDKLLDDNYNALDKVAFIDKNIRLDSPRTTSWKKGKAIFKYTLICKNIDAGLLDIESNSAITAHDITAWKINCIHIYADNLNCQYLKARVISVNATNAQRIYSNSVLIRTLTNVFYSYDTINHDFIDAITK